MSYNFPACVYKTAKRIKADNLKGDQIKCWQEAGEVLCCYKDTSDGLDLLMPKSRLDSHFFLNAL